MSEFEAVVRARIRACLESSPTLLPRNTGSDADGHGERQAAIDQVARQIAHAMTSSGWLPFDPSQPLSQSSYYAVSYTMGRMRTRLTKHIRGGGRDPEAERAAMESVAIAFFDDLERQGWRLVQINVPAGAHSTSPPPRHD